MQITEKEIQDFIDNNTEWSLKTFGGCSPLPVLDHLASEVKEVYAAIRNSEGHDNIKFEFADCFILLMQAADKQGISFRELFEAANKKMYINKNRQWIRPDNMNCFKHISEANKQI